MLSEVREQVSTVTRKYDDVNTTLADMRKRLSQEIQDAQKDVQRTAQHASLQDERANVLEERYERLELERDSLRKRTVELERSNQELSIQLTETSQRTARNDADVVRIGQLEHRIRDLERTSGDKELDLRKLEKQIDTLMEDKEELNMALDVKQQEVDLVRVTPRYSETRTNELWLG